MVNFKDFESEKRFNNLQREFYINKTLNELLIDLNVCKLMKQFNEEALDPLDEWKIYLEKFKKEIDDLYERVSNRKVRTINK